MRGRWRIMAGAPVGEGHKPTLSGSWRNHMFNRFLFSHNNLSFLHRKRIRFDSQDTKTANKA